MKNLVIAVLMIMLAFDACCACDCAAPRIRLFVPDEVIG